MRLDRLDHLVLTVADLDATIAFYTRVLGMTAHTFDGRHALHFGRQKINLHCQGHEFEPKAHRAVPGSADLCFVAEGTIEEVMSHLTTCGAEVEVGPVDRIGALGPMRSVYIRDLDRNLIEIAVYADGNAPDEGTR